MWVKRAIVWLGLMDHHRTKLFLHRRFGVRFPAKSVEAVGVKGLVVKFRLACSPIFLTRRIRCQRFQKVNDRNSESAMRALEAEIANIGTHLTIDAQARAAYGRQIRAMASDLRRQATNGRITWHEAAEQANTARNTIMDMIRRRSTPVGRAIAESLKRRR